jgi:restriction system protein
VFLGLLELIRYYHELQIDINRNLRRVLIFEFKIHSENLTIPINMAKSLTRDFLPKNRKDLLNDKFEQEVEVPEIQQLQLPESELLELESVRSQLFNINPYKFEHLLKDLIERTGFSNVSVTPPSQDGGIDINAYVKESNVFFANTLVQFQAKRWRHSIGSVEINNFRGALSSIAKGVFVTTSHFTKNAIQEAKNTAKPSIALIDGFSLANLLLENQLKITSE